MGIHVQWYLGAADGLPSVIAAPIVLDRLEPYFEGCIRSTRDRAYIDAMNLLRRVKKEGTSAFKAFTSAEARAADIVQDAFMYLSQSKPAREGGLDSADGGWRVEHFIHALNLLKLRCPKEVCDLWEVLLYGRTLWTHGGGVFEVPSDPNDRLVNRDCIRGYWTQQESQSVRDHLERAFGVELNGLDPDRDDEESRVLEALSQTRTVTARAVSSGQGLIWTIA